MPSVSAKKPRKTALIVILAILGVLILGGAAFAIHVQQGVQPLPEGDKVIYRVEQSMPRGLVFRQLRDRGVIRNSDTAELYARFVLRSPARISDGSYQLSPGMTIEQVTEALQKPLRNFVRIPEGYWIARTAALLEKNEVCPAADYIRAANEAERFQGIVKAPIPESGSLEGYLYPDTYDLPPGISADRVIQMQLQAFSRKAWQPLGKPDRDELHRAVIIGSMVQLEAAIDEERPVIAGVMINRLNRPMRLEIDATINYALQEWRPLLRSEYRSVDSPYNTYLVNGLPPGPIGSPSFASINAAMNPQQHRYIFYVAIPGSGGRHAFSETYEEHNRNIQRRNELRKRLRESE
jgi:UPF0755 protein